MNKMFLVSIAAATLLVTGCPRNHYVVEIKPDGDGMERSLICWREDGDKPQEFPGDELTSLQRLYGNDRFEAEGQKHSFNGRFAGATPNDIGGAGLLTHYDSSLGKAFIYEERFRGKDDLLERWQKREQAADELVDALIGWFKTELGNDPRFERLHTFMDRGFRKDIKNISLYSWHAETAAAYKPESSEEFLVRVAQYFLEHGYYQIKDLPLILKGLDDPAYESQRLALLQRIVAERMGVAEGAPLPASLAFLGKMDSLKASLEKYLKTTAMFQAKLSEWEEAKKNNPETPQPDPLDALAESASSTLEISMNSTKDLLTLRLVTGVKPAQTNGKWDEATGKVSWQVDMEQSEYKQIPPVCYATWARPDEKFQKEHFGRVLLTGENLADYCLWHASLPERESKRWDEFVNGLLPGKEMATKVDAFRFDAALTDDADLSTPARKLIAEALEKAAP